MTIKFSDGMTFDTKGNLRIICKSDGMYVVGEGMLIPIDSEEEWVMVEEVIESFMNEDQEEVDEMDVIDTEELPQ